MSDGAKPHSEDEEGMAGEQRLTALLGAPLVVWRKTLQNEQTAEGFFQTKSVTRRKAKLKKLK